MLDRLLADLVVVVHLGFLVFVAVGALLAWRWRSLLWVHVASLSWAMASITLGLPCPLTTLEKFLRELAGDEVYRGGFVDHYVEDVVYPGSLTPWLHAVALVAIVVGYAGLRHRRGTTSGLSGIA